ncbi:DUF2269 family protein [Rubellimicrobium roseum]|uniref:DUF2269 family protein n=1 Tax=Rubellimicrobium roseum TaxID=687525 RepID=A0A5C4NDR5_9RHOB|nr:DUF2269 family protein [Rubellimicrobium roseum]TNC68514.1 DUF2269 family protein [Rubellimicrobium roseum]
MDPYLLLKLVHVVGAILWVGGASIMTLLVLLLDRRGDDAATMTGVSYVALLGNRVFLPLSLLVILTGLGLAWLGGWGFAAWTVLATAVVVATAALGGAVLGPTTERAVKVWRDEGDMAQAIALGRRVLRLVKVDLGGQFAIIALMVLKPGWTDPALLVPVAFLGCGVALGLMPGRARASAAQPA